MATSGFHDLDKAQQAEFLEHLRVRGLDPKQVIGVHLRSSDCGGTIRINSSVDESHVLAHYRTLYDVAELKRWSRITDESIASRPVDHTVYPAEFTQDAARLAGRYSDRRALNMLLGEKGQADVRQALRAYVGGDSRRVTELGWVPLINRLHFPMRVTVVAADTITVDNGQTAIFGSVGDPPQELGVAGITMYGTGSLQFESDYTIQCTGTMAQIPA